MNLYQKPLKFDLMKELSKISDTSYAPFISVGTPIESSFTESTASPDTLSEFFKNEYVLIEDDYFEVPLIRVDVSVINI